MGRLLDLTVQDFKSYKGHQLIGPFHDFTAVIGPNGSGKSNLMDAISFVLGVKSSQLRSSQLKELVFRPDAGQEGPDTCFVACRYEHDGTTTEFKRTVTAAGSSEYRIDNKLSSFQAYLAQLEKYGILVKSRNFLVFQGDVEQVASQSPKDLTRLIEQISGSLELKEEYDRLQALQEKATEASSLNFNRKRTMHADLKQFKEKKDEAARFKKLQTKKQNLVQTKITCQLYHIEQRVANLQQDIQTENSQSIQSESEKAKFESQMKAAKKTYAKANKEVLLLEKTLKTKKAEQRTMQPDVLQAEEKVRHAESKTKTSEEHISTAQESITRQEAQVESLQRDLGHVIKALEAHEALGTSKAAHPDLGQAQMKEFDKLSSQVDAETVNERTKIKALKRQTHASREGINRIQESIQAQKLRQTALKQEKTALELQSGKFSSSVNSTRSDLKEIQAKRKEIDLEQKRLCQLELEVNEKLDETVNGLLQAKVDQQETRRHKQFKETLERLARLFPGVQGRLLDLCKPSQRKYDLAVSIILGKNMDAIVVNNEKTALECIRYMREQRCGHATFIPLDTIQAKPVAEKYRTFCKGARLAIDVIQFEPQSERAVHYAVGNAVVSDTMETARYICYEKQQQVKVVTLSGTIIHKTGMITGGYSDINNAKRWEEKELERLQHSRQTLTAQLDDIQKAKRKAHHTEDFLSQMTQLEIKYDKLQEDLTATQQKLASVNLELVHIRSVLEGLEEDLERAQEPAQEIQDEIDQAQAIINECQDRLFASFCTQIGVVDIRDFNQRKLSSTQNAAQKRLEYSTSKARLESALLFEQERLDECRGRLTRLLERDQEIQNNKAEMSQELAKFDLGSKQLQADSALIGHRLEESRKKLEQQGEALLRAKQESQEFENFSETIYKNISRLVSFILSRNRRLRRKLQNRWPCFANEIDLPDAMDVDQSEPLSTKIKNNSADQDAAFEQQLRDICSEIDRIAPHIRGANHFDEAERKLRETAQEFESSRQEAKAAKEAFQEIKKERFKRFHSAFTHIADNIDRIYKDLTKSKTFPMGGTAYLSLEDSDEPYLDGVKYHAMPPMKRFREMELLSGGEKTIAALALLFAINSTHPSPFFVLDEVDAALDNTNVSKMTEYLSSHCQDLQFIVISLKSALYERASSLVGIYRDQEESSSKILTLDLGQFQE